MDNQLGKAFELVQAVISSTNDTFTRDAPRPSYNQPRCVISAEIDLLK